MLFFGTLVKDCAKHLGNGPSQDKILAKESLAKKNLLESYRRTSGGEIVLRFLGKQEFWEDEWSYLLFHEPLKNFLSYLWKEEKGSENDDKS